jgi:prolyl oligopeptidase
VIAAHNGFVYLLCSAKDAYNEVRAFHINPEGKSKSHVVVPERDYLISRVYFSDETFFVESLRGEDRRIRIHNLAGKRTAQIEIPSCCRIMSIRWKEKNHSLRIFLSSAINDIVDFTYEVKTRKWSEDPKVTMMVKDEINYLSETLLLTSKDGRNFPIRVTRRSDLKKDKRNPLLINSYGGFNISGYFEPRFDFLEAEFLKRGGIVVGPALRGGNEVGPLWHKEAHFLAKEKTYDDLAATARYFVKEEWTEVSKIISYGASNGGLTVSASALLNPHHFGLVIPMAGVLDLLAKDRLDASFQGWSQEYGSNDNGSENEEVIRHLQKISPLENTHQAFTSKFFIITGASDSRVNPAHSIKFAAALDASGVQADQRQLLSIKKGGHFVGSKEYSNSRAWTFNFYLWGKIFEQSFENPFTPYLNTAGPEIGIPSL